MFHYKKLAHTIMEADNSPDLQLATWRPRRAKSVDSVQEQTPDPGRADVLVQVQMPEKSKVQLKDSQAEVPTYSAFLSYLFFKDFIYLFLEEKDRRKRRKETLICGCLLCTPYWGPGPQPRHVP